MAQNYTWPAVSVTATNPSIGSNGATAPIFSTEVAGINPSGNLQPLQTDASGNLKVALTSSTAEQNVNLNQVGGSAIAIGQATMAASLPVAIASNQSTLPISAASLPLPTGAATSALQTTISGQLPTTLGQKVSASSLAVVIASDQSTLPVSGTITVTGVATSANQTNGAQKTQIVDGSGNVIASTSNALNVSAVVTSSALPTGAATAANQASEITQLTNISGQLPATLGAHVTAASLAVNIASDQVVPVSATALPLPTGAATSANQTSEITQLTAINTNTSHLPTALGQTTMSASLPVVIASNQTPITTSEPGKSVANAPVYNIYSSTPVTTSAYVQLVASTTSASNMIEIFDSSGQSMIIGVGASGSEVVQLYTLPGGNGQVPLAIPAGSRVAIKALTASATSGYLTINFYS